MPYKVCHISTVHSANDVRIFEKECVTLSNHGYEVYFVATSEKEMVKNNIRIVPLSNKRGRIYRMIVKTIEAFIKALKINASIYHFHDPELIGVGLLLKIAGKKVIYDVHEDVSAQVLSKEWINRGLRTSISGVFNFYEKFSARFFDAVVSVTPEIVESFKAKRKVLVRNYPVTSIIERAEPVPRDKDKKIIIYAGGLIKIRGIKEIIDSIEPFKGSVEFWLLGKWDSEEYKKECEESPGWKYTKYMGSKPLSEVYTYMKAADIGMCTLYPVKNYLESLPIKVFEYMACGIPVVMSDFPYWQEKFSEVAEFVDPKEANSIYKAIENLLNQEDIRIQKGRDGKKLSAEIYNWEKEEEKLIKLYEELL